MVGFSFVLFGMALFTVKEVFLPQTGYDEMYTASVLIGLFGIVVALCSGYRKRGQLEREIHPALLQADFASFILADIAFLGTIAFLLSIQ